MVTGTDGILLTIKEEDFLAVLDSLEVGFKDGLSMIGAIRASLSGTGPTPPPPRPVLSDVVVTPGHGVAVTDAGSWTVDTSSHILLNGKMAYKGWQTTKLVQTPDETIYIFGMSGEGWYIWNGKDFVPSTAPAGV